MPELYDDWRERMAAHEARADALTRDHLARRQRHEKHPVYDFLFEYYPVRPSHLRRWHPGIGVALPGETPHAQWRDYHFDGVRTAVDVPALWERRGESLLYIRDLLHRTNLNPAHFDCFGLHEWAMVYRADETRHPVPLRLGQARTDAVVDSHQVKCTHYDAYRFFTPEAAPLNRNRPTRDTQPACEQAGCLHANMDLYKWATKLAPLVPGELWLDSFELARDIRRLDMEASPYDLADRGFAPVPVETPEGKAEYVRRQRGLAGRAAPIRSALLQLADDFLG